MPLPSIEFLHRAVDLHIDGFQPALLKGSPEGASVYRLWLESHRGSLPFRSLILKQIPSDSPEAVPREVRFYREILPTLDIAHPQVHFIGTELAGSWLILLEDLGETHFFPEPGYHWTADELQRVLGAYARLHAAGAGSLPAEAQRGWLLSYAAQDLPLADFPGIADVLVHQGIWPSAPPVGRLVDELIRISPSLDSIPPTILHNDLYPPNFALPRRPEAPAMLVDWGMAGWGAAELDLAYLSLQPFRSGQAISPTAALEGYWQVRGDLEGRLPPAGERRLRQHCADLLLSLWFLQQMARTVAHPFPAGSPTQAYWQAMRGVLYDRLALLAGEGSDA